ncbi:hypothetical protein OESDEN_03929 [Oesophagostomum dentatum]|uniref:Uncharacterized protein n=1 Tax=Oesophagostomum dentatum TaxID=61180 RepID=A0A0B1TL51_OESDE|nr:hypothetical protein OESDEN_03929 [Oesophagostomum dentatum]
MRLAVAAEMKCPLSNSPTAAEFLEATKKLYVKTDALIQRKIEPGQPRLFQSTDDEDQICYKLPSPSAGTFHIPSRRSAFRLVRHPSPTNQSAEQFRRKSTSPPPLNPRSTSLAEVTQPRISYAWKPKPKPRLSLMRSMVNLSVDESEPPQPKPRRKVFASVCDPVKHTETHPISIESPRQSPQSPFSYHRKSITKSSPNLFAPSVAALKRRVHSLRAPTPVPHSEEPSVMFPVMDESERDFLRAAVRLTYSSDDEDSNPPSPSFGRRSFLFNPEAGRCTEKSCSPQSPATDSGRPNSDDEDRRTHPCSTKSLDDGFFDSSFHRKDEDTPSEALTSISNLRKTTDNSPEDEIRDGHISILEKNARVMRWIHGCAAVPAAR